MFPEVPAHPPGGYISLLSTVNSVKLPKASCLTCDEHWMRCALGFWRSPVHRQQHCGQNRDDGNHHEQFD